MSTREQIVINRRSINPLPQRQRITKLNGFTRKQTETEYIKELENLVALVRQQRLDKDGY